jgi:hypothetical protein
LFVGLRGGRQIRGTARGAGCGDAIVEFLVQIIVEGCDALGGGVWRALFSFC